MQQMVAEKSCSFDKCHRKTSAEIFEIILYDYLLRTKYWQNSLLDIFILKGIIKQNEI